MPLQSEIALTGAQVIIRDHKNYDLQLGLYWLQNQNCRKWENVRPLGEIRAGSSNSFQIISNRRLSILPTGLALFGEIALGSQQPDFIKEKVDHGYRVSSLPSCALVPVFLPPLPPTEETQRCFWNVILDNSGYQVTFHLAIQTGWMSQHKKRAEVGEGGKSHGGEQGKKEGDDKRSL